MGSCYSCKSGQHPSHSYTTLAMANTDKAATVDNGKRVSPYTRGYTSSFGFNKRRVPAALKSLSQDTTREMVNNYESKIANINANNVSSAKTSPKHVVNNRIQSHIPRFGHKTMSTSSLESSEDIHSSNSSLNNTDSNSNSITITQRPKSNLPKAKFTDTSKLTNQVKKRSQENSPETRKNANKVHSQVEKDTQLPKPRKSGLKPPCKVTTQLSGLPKPQVVQGAGAKSMNLSSKMKFHTKAPLAQFDEIEAMQISSDTLPDDDVGVTDLDSGLGNSDSDKMHKQEGDNETLGELSELASDTASTGRNSKERSPEKMTPKKTIHKPKQTKDVVNVLSATKDKQIKAGGYQVLVPLRKATNLSKTIASKFNEEDDFGESQKDEEVKIEDIKIEEVHLNRPKIEYKKKPELNIIPMTKYLKHQTPEITKNVKTAVEKAKPEKPMDTSTTSVESSTSPRGSSLGAISPPSEKDTFLIDDEICDQPGLIACEDSGMRNFLRSADDYFVRDQDVFAEDGGNEGMAVFRCGSLDTLSSSSSVNSNDLMLDFDHGDDNTLMETSTRRLSCGDDGETNPQENMKPQSRHRSKSLKIQQHSDSFEVIDEWTNLVESHSKDGTPLWPKSHRMRSASSPDATSSPESRILRPPRQMTPADVEDGGVTIDPSSYRSLGQDVTNLKTMLLKLKRVIQESETVNPFEMHNIWKNGLFHNLALTDPPRGCNIKEERNEENMKNEQLTQENSDLRRQVVFLQQQLDEKDKIIHLLQQQMTKYTNCASAPSSPKSENCNAATQTDKPRLSLTSMSQSHDGCSYGTTVSSNNTDVCGNSSSKINGLSQQNNNITRSMNSLTPVTPEKTEEEDHPLSPLDRSASAFELSTASQLTNDASCENKAEIKSDKIVGTSSEVTRTRSSRLASRIPSIRRSSSGNQKPKTVKSNSNLKMSLPPTGSCKRAS